jgi:hypothetical protein
MNYKEIQKAVWAESIERKAHSPLCDKLQDIFSKYQNKNHWKNPFTAVNVPVEEVEWLKAGIEWYHGSKPECNGNIVSSFGYACD